MLCLLPAVRPSAFRVLFDDAGVPGTNLGRASQVSSTRRIGCPAGDWPAERTCDKKLLRIFPSSGPFPAALWVLRASNLPKVRSSFD